MVKYVLINLKNTGYPTIISEAERILYDDYAEDGKLVYICEKCFKAFGKMNDNHLSKCNLAYPINAYPCYNNQNAKIRIFELDEERGYNGKLMNCVTRMSEFSKLEQGIDSRITQRGLVGKGFICYILFHYKNIAAYCLIQEYQQQGEIIHLIFRDIYTSNQFRHKKYATLLLETIAKRYGLPIDYFLFSAPISDGLKSVLRKYGLKQVITIQGENLKTRGSIDL